MTLKARWKTADSAKTESTKTEKTKTKDDDGTWNYREIAKNKTGTKTAKTGDETRMPWVLGCVAGAAGIVTFCFYKKKRKG